MLNRQNEAALNYAENRSNIEKLVENLFDNTAAKDLNYHLWYLVELAFASTQADELTASDRQSLLNVYKVLSTFVNKASLELKMQNGSSFPTIMQSTANDLKEIIRSYMSRYDDLMQTAADLNYPEVSETLSETYNELNAWYFTLRDKVDLTVDERNSIRMTIKNAEKQLPENVVLGIF